MKKIEAFLHYVCTADVVRALRDVGYHNITIQDVKGKLILLNEFKQGYLTKSGTALISEVHLTLICQDAEVDAVTTIIRAAGHIGARALGWVYISPVEPALAVGGSKT